MPKTEAEKAAKKAAKATQSTTPDPFEASPASSAGLAKVGSGGDLFRPKDYGDGTLLLFYPQRIDTNVTTQFGTEAEVPVGKVIVLDGKGAPLKVFPSTPVFGKTHMNALRPAFEAGKPTAGVLRQRTFKNGTGWVIDSSDEADAAATAYISQQASNLLA